MQSVQELVAVAHLCGALDKAVRSLFVERLRPRFSPPARSVKKTLLVGAGCLIGALSYPMFLLPNSIAPGGITGITTILNHLFGLPVGLSSLFLNLPLFVAGYRLLGSAFFLKTVLATAFFSVLIDLLKAPPLTGDPLMSAVFGGALLGAGLALILRGGATSGGTDLLARIVHKRIPVVSVGAFLFAFDTLVIAAAGFTMTPEHAMYSMVCVYICARVMDVFLAGIGTDKACSIITTRADALKARLISEVGRGVTVLSATGAYSGRSVDYLVCVVGVLEIVRVKAIVREEDPQAFMFITDTHETLGEGFRNIISDEI